MPIVKCPKCGEEYDSMYSFHSCGKLWDGGARQKEKRESQDFKNIPWWVFFLISLTVSFFLIGEANFYWWMIFVVPVFALWFTVPIFFGEADESPILTILGYIVWVVIQSIIYYFGISPPGTAGMPHF